MPFPSASRAGAETGYDRAVGGYVLNQINFVDSSHYRRILANLAGFIDWLTAKNLVWPSPSSEYFSLCIRQFQIYWISIDTGF
jgi:hypothetical protein